MRLRFIFTNQKNTKERFQVRKFSAQKKFADKVLSFSLDYVRRFATEEALRETEKKDDSSDSELSDFSDDETKDMEL